MKKLLLLLLLTMLIKSFAKVRGTDNNVEMPIVVKGIIISGNGTDLVIEPTENASRDGSSIELDFGRVTQGEERGDSRTILEGGFSIYRNNRSTVINTDDSKIAVGFLDYTGTGVLEQRFLGELGGVSELTGHYTVLSTLNSEKTKITGTVRVSINVGLRATPGSFQDSSQKIAVIIKP